MQTRKKRIGLFNQTWQNVMRYKRPSKLKRFICLFSTILFQVASIGYFNEYKGYSLKYKWIKTGIFMMLWWLHLFNCINESAEEIFLEAINIDK